MGKFLKSLEEKRIYMQQGTRDRTGFNLSGFFYYKKNLQVAHIIQFYKNKKYDKINTNKT